MKYIFPILLFFFCTLANAVTADAGNVVGIIKSSMLPSVGIITAMAIKTLSGFVLLQFIVTNIGLLKSGGDIEQAWAKLLGSLFWFGFCFYVISNGPEFIKGVGNQFFDLLGIGLPDPSIIIGSTLAMSVPLSVLGVIVGVASTVGGQAILGVALFIFGTGLFFAIKIFMIQLELALVVMLSPLSFSMLGLNALKDQGIAPFKALISLIYRIILMTIILAGFTQVSNVMADLLNQAMTEATSLKGLVGAIVPGMENPFSKIFGILFSGLGAYALLAYMLYKSDSIAASLASGSTSMGTADVASGVAAGVAAGMAAHSSGGVAAGAAGKGTSAMSDMIKGMRQSASVTNASSSGTGSTASGSKSNGGLNSLGDAPKGAPKSPNLSAKDLRQIAKGNGASPSSGNSSASTNNASSSSGASTANGPGKASNQSTTNGKDSSANKSASDMGLGAAPSGMRYTNTDPSPKETAQSTPSGNAANAGIGEGGGGLEKQLGALIDQLGKQGSSKPGAKDRLSSLNDHIGRESAATHVSINTHGHD